MSDAEPSSEGCRHVRVLELFAGIGGMRLALSYAGLDVEAVAVEVNQQALRVYAHNFGHECLVNRDLCGLSAKWFEKQACRIWTMSPPCQPYTRQGNVRDAEDPRAKPLLHIISVLREVANPPEAIVLENVRNFENSESFARLVEVLELRGYHWRSFLLSPRQFGFPNARQRFYMVAKLRPWSSRIPAMPAVLRQSCDGEDVDKVGVFRPWQCLGPCSKAHAFSSTAAEPDTWQAASDLVARAEEARDLCPSCERSAPVPDLGRTGSEEMASSVGSRDCRFGRLTAVSDFLDSQDNGACWLVPEAIMQKESARCFDVLQGGCCHSLCFTKAYGRYIDGTGSVYALPERIAEPGPDMAGTMKDFFGILR
ncbi:unnamed protein product, partial [Polarella glacialis]